MEKNELLVRYFSGRHSTYHSIVLRFLK